MACACKLLNQKNQTKCCYPSPRSATRGGSTDECVGCIREFVEAHQKDFKSGFCFFSHGCVTASKDSLPVHLWCVWCPKRSQNLMLFLPKSCSPGSFQKSCGCRLLSIEMQPCVWAPPPKRYCVLLSFYAGYACSLEENPKWCDCVCLLCSQCRHQSHAW